MKGSPFKVDDGPGKGKGKGKNDGVKKATANAARQLLKEYDGINDPNMTDAEVLKAAKVKNVYGEARSLAKQAYKAGDRDYGFNYNWKS